MKLEGQRKNIFFILEKSLQMNLWPPNFWNAFILGDLNYFSSGRILTIAKTYAWYRYVNFVALINSRIEVVPTLGSYPKMFRYVGLTMRFPIILYEKLMTHHL